MNLQFHPLSLSDKERLTGCFDRSGNNSCENSFNCAYIWKDVNAAQVAYSVDYAVVASFKKGYPATYLFPVGGGDPQTLIPDLAKYAKSKGDLLVFHALLEWQKQWLEENFPNKFEFMPLENSSDYVYDAEKLISLSGKKLHGKRNHINRFLQENPSYAFEGINADNMPEIKEMNRQWCIINGCGEDRSFSSESCAVKTALSHFFELSLDGALLRVAGKVCAFTIGGRLNADTYNVNIEKAFAFVEGAYPMINREFAAKYASSYKYINREDDAGNPGLRKAKQSYRPAFMINKYAAKAEPEALLGSHDAKA